MFRCLDEPRLAVKLNTSSNGLQETKEHTNWSPFKERIVGTILRRSVTTRTFECHYACNRTLQVDFVHETRVMSSSGNVRDFIYLFYDPHIRSQARL